MNTMQTLTAALAAVASLAAAQTPAEIPLWPSGAPGSEGKTAKEAVTTSASGELSVSSIHIPSLTPYVPSREKANGPAILVIPGGGHRMLAITHEGYNVAEWLRDHGIAAFVLKHRLAREAESTYKIEVESLADTLRAIRLIRSRAKEWNIDAGRVGAVGFSAGGELVSMAATKSDGGNASAADLIDRESSKLDFQALIYPGRSGDIQPTKESPPVFLAASYTDRQDISEGLAEAYLRFKRAGVVAELHLYSTGGHGFGLRATNKRPVGNWIVRFEEGMKEGGFVSSAWPTGFPQKLLTAENAEHAEQTWFRCPFCSLRAHRPGAPRSSQNPNTPGSPVADPATWFARCESCAFPWTNTRNIMSPAGSALSAVKSSWTPFTVA